MKSLEIRELMTKAKEMGYGELRGSGTKLEFRATKNVGEMSAKVAHPEKPNVPMVFSPDSPQVSASVGEMSAANEILESIENTGVQPSPIKFVGDVGDFGTIREKTLRDESVGENSLIGDLAQEGLDVGEILQGDPPPLNTDENLSLIAPTSPTISPLETPTIDTEPVMAADNEPTQLPTQLPTQSSTEAQTLVEPEPETADILPTLAPTLADSCQQKLELDNINYSDYLSVETALKQAFRLGEGKEATVGKIYANACSNIQVLIADSTVIPDETKQYILHCYHSMLNEMNQH
jgi:hypothetical protein